MAKLNPLFMLVITLVVVLLFFIVTSWQDYVPYDNVKPKYAAYEPFTENAETDKDKEKETMVNVNGTVSPLSGNVAIESEPKPSDNGVGSLIKGVLSGVVPASSSAENFEPLMESPKSIHYGPFRDSEIIDKFSQVTSNGQDGVNGCVSSGLSNAGGYICLTPELIQMLKTRGGNAAGK